MTGKTPGTIVGDGLLREGMRIVAGSAPELSVALACTHTKRKLFHLAYDPEIADFALRREIVIDRERLFQCLSRFEIAEPLAGIQHAGHPDQVALFANRISCRGSEPGRVDDISRAGIGQMLRRGTVTPVAADDQRMKGWRCIFIPGTDYRDGLVRMAEEAACRDWPSKIRITARLETRCQAIAVASAIIGDG